MEELGNDGFLPKSFTTPPAEATPNTEPATTEQNAVVESQAQTTPAEPTPQAPVSETKPDTFIDEMNKRFGSQFKSDDEIKGLFGLPQKIAEYEPKVKSADELSKRIAELEKANEEIKNAGYSELLSKPSIRNAYVAEQLLTKYPDKDPEALRQIVMADVSKLSDFDVLVKNQKIDLPNLSEHDIREVLLDKYGIDPDAKPEDWSSISRAKVAIDAQSARANIKALTQGIEMPKTVSKEERDRAIAEAAAQRNQAIEPLKAKFTQFDKFKDERIPDLGDFDVPSDYKSKLGNMFQAMLVDAGLEPSQENFEVMTEFRDAMLVKESLPKIWEIAVKHGATKAQKELDEKLHNTQLPNTATATDFKEQKDELPGPSLASAFASGKL
jgi:Fe-S-cluster formation regulator IscX/YfhJ